MDEEVTTLGLLDELGEKADDLYAAINDDSDLSEDDKATLTKDVEAIEESINAAKKIVKESLETD